MDFVEYNLSSLNLFIAMLVYVRKRTVNNHIDVLSI